MEVVNHKTGDKCFMKFEPYSYFGGIAKKVTGTITSGSDSEKVKYLLYNLLAAFMFVYQTSKLLFRLNGC